MYTKINNKNSTVLIFNQLIKEVKPLLTKCANSINHQSDQDCLLSWVVDVFSEDFSDDFGLYQNDILEKLVLCVINIRYPLINDPVKFCEDFNAEGLNLKIGFDRGFYPSTIGHWYNKSEFVIL